MTFEAKRVDRSASFIVARPPEEALQLFTAEGERAWAPGWNPVYLYPPDGRTEEGMAFMTGEGAETTLWLMTRYDAARHEVQYARVTPASRMGTVTVACDPAGQGRTQVTVRYVLTALNEAGNAFLEKLGEKEYREFIETWKDAIGKLGRTDR